MKQTNRVLITGASRGIGRALVDRFLRDAQVEVIAISRSAPPQNLATESAQDGRLIWIAADISKQEGREMVAKTVKDAGDLSVLLHNAATLVYKPFDQIGEQELRELYSVNVFAPFLLTQLLLPYLQSAHVVAISSVGGVMGSIKFPGLSAYSSSKGALNTWIEVMAAEYAHTGMSFNALALGSVGTEMFAAAFPGADAGSDTSAMADYIYDFSIKRGSLIKGKIISVSSSNP